MLIELPPLPYAFDALAPLLSAEALECHYGRHQRGYVERLNELIANTPFAGLTLDDIVRTASGTIFNNAAQVWNHTFYWRSLRPGGGCVPAGALAATIAAQFGALEQLRDAFLACAVANFGSGWTWLVKQRVDDSLAIVSTSNAETPLTESTFVPLLVVDVWEHAYYIDYRNARAAYLEAFWKMVNWDFASANYAR